MITLMLTLAACGGGEAGDGDSSYPFVEAATGRSIYRVQIPDDLVGTAINSPVPAELIDQLAALDGVETALGLVGTPNIQLHDADGEIVYSGGYTLGDTWTDFGLKPPIDIVTGEAPAGDEFIVHEDAVEAGGLVVGEPYEIRAEMTTVALTLSGVYASQYFSTNRILVDSATALRLFSRNGSFDQGLVAIDSSADISKTVDRIADLLPEPLEVVAHYGLGPPTPVSEGLVADVCEYLDDGGNSLIRVIDMAKDADREDPWTAAMSVAESLPITCPQWEVLPDANNILFMASALVGQTAAATDFDTAELFDFWAGVCKSLDRGETPQPGPNGLDLRADDRHIQEIAVLGTFAFCEEHADTIQELIAGVAEAPGE